MKEPKNVTLVTYMGRRYILVSDVADYNREIAASEETDVRMRLEEAAHNLENPIRAS